MLEFVNMFTNSFDILLPSPQAASGKFARDPNSWQFAVMFKDKLDNFFVYSDLRVNAVVHFQKSQYTVHVRLPFCRPQADILHQES